MAALPPVGAPTDPLSAPSLSAFAAAVRATLDGSDVTVDTRIGAVALTPGPPGADGPPGAAGPEGPQGPPGGAYLSAQWTFNQTTTPPPVSGGVRLNATTFAAATLLYISETDRDGLDRNAGLNVATVGDQIMVQSAQGRGLFNITSVTDSGTYRTIGVTLVESSGTRPSASAITTVYIISTTGGGGGSPSNSDQNILANQIFS